MKRLAYWIVGLLVFSTLFGLSFDNSDDISPDFDRMIIDPATSGNNITDNSSWQLHPDIWRDRIVWEDYRNEPLSWGAPGTKNADIYMYNTSSKNTIQLISNDSDQRNPDIWRDIVVWEDYRNGDADIYYIDLNEPGTEIRLTTSSEDDTLPSVYKNKIVYFQGTDLMLYDLDEEKNYTLRDTTYGKEHLTIYGDKIVWSEETNWPNADVFLFNLSEDSDSDGIYDYKDQDNTELENSTYPIATESNINEHSPSIWFDTLTWVERRGGDNDIYMRDINRHPEVISQNGSQEEEPVIYGGRILYVEQYENETGVNTKDILWCYDRYDSSEFKIAEVSSGNIRAPSIYENRTVWEQSNETGIYEIYHEYLENRPPEIVSTNVSEDGITWKENASMDLLPEEKLEFRTEVRDMDGDVKDIKLNLSELGLSTGKVDMEHLEGDIYNSTLNYDRYGGQLDEGSYKVHVEVVDKAGHLEMGENITVDLNREYDPSINSIGVSSDGEGYSSSTTFILSEGNSIFFRANVTDEDGDLDEVYINSSKFGTSEEKHQMKEITDPTGTWNFGLEIDHNENMEPGTVYVNVTAVDENGHNDTSGPLTINMQSAPPYVIETIPTGEGVSVDPFSSIKVVFSDVMDDETIPDISHLRGEVPEGLEFKGWNETFQRDDTAVWTHDGWDNGEDISLAVSNYYDEYGVKGKGYTWNFTTKWSPDIVDIGHSNINESSVRLEMNFTSGDYDTILVRFKYRKSGESGWTVAEQKQFSENGTHSTMITSLEPNTSYEYLGHIEFQGRNITSEIRNFTTEPLDTDDDGIPDWKDTDDDNDTIPDEWEEKYGFDPKDPTDAEEDYDQDGLTNLEEYNKGTYPDNPDSDGDGVYDDKDKYPMDSSKSSDFPWLKIIAWIVISLVITALGVIIFLLLRRARPSEDDEEEIEKNEGEVSDVEDNVDEDIEEEDIDELIDQL